MRVRVGAALAAWGIGCSELPIQQGFAPRPDPKADSVQIAKRTPELSMLPCKDDRCHAGPNAPTDTSRPLEEFHRGKQLEHGETVVWCYWCHSESLERLKLLDGTEVDLDHAYQLCGQCHGDRFRDWRNGVHGRQTGHWSGPKVRESCPSCHNPHKPKGRILRAKPPPTPLRPPVVAHSKHEPKDETEGESGDGH